MGRFCEMLEGNPGLSPKAIQAPLAVRGSRELVSYFPVMVVWLKEGDRRQGPMLLGSDPALWVRYLILPSMGFLCMDGDSRTPLRRVK